MYLGSHSLVLLTKIKVPNSKHSGVFLYSPCSLPQRPLLSLSWAHIVWPKNIFPQSDWSANSPVQHNGKKRQRNILLHTATLKLLIEFQLQIILGIIMDCRNLITSNNCCKTCKEQARKTNNSHATVLPKETLLIRPCLLSESFCEETGFWGPLAWVRHLSLLFLLAILNM